jgi:FtsH-binding integral membrane protein
LAVCAAGIITGGQYVVSFDYRTAGMNASFYTEKMQYAIHHIGTPLFSMLIATTVLSFSAAVLNRRDRRTCFLLAGAGCLFLTGGLITAFGNIPLLDTIDTWNVSSPPSNWKDVADRWYLFHSVRLGVDVVGLFLAVLSIFALRNADQQR